MLLVVGELGDSATGSCASGIGWTLSGTEPVGRRLDPSGIASSRGNADIRYEPRPLTLAARLPALTRVTAEPAARPRRGRAAAGARSPRLRGMRRAARHGDPARGLPVRHAPCPPERELAERLQVSRATLREAIAALRTAGLVETRRGRGGGTVVTYSPRRPRARVRGATPARRRPTWLDSLVFRRIVEPGAVATGRGARPRPRRSARLLRRRTTAVTKASQLGPPPPGRQPLPPHLRLGHRAHRDRSRRSPRVQASLHEMLQCDPRATTNIAHSDRAARGASCAPCWTGGPTGRARPWKNTATTRPRCCAACSAERRPGGDRMPPNDRYLTLETLREADRERRDRHRRARVHRHAGPAAGQAPARASTSSTSRWSTAPRAATTCSRSTST